MSATATKTPSPSFIARKIAAMTALIDHASTPQGEKDAAEGRRAQFREALAAALATQGTGYSWAPRWAGAKFVRGEYLSSARVAALIRAEIKVARLLGKVQATPGEVALPDPVADAPAQIKFGARVNREGSITVWVKNVPPEWGYAPDARRDIYNRPCEGPTVALYRLGWALADLANQWNYDNSDSQVDYFDRGYCLTVKDADRGYSIDFDPEHVRWA